MQQALAEEVCHLSALLTVDAVSAVTSFLLFFDQTWAGQRFPCSCPVDAISLLL